MPFGPEERTNEEKPFLCLGRSRSHREDVTEEQVMADPRLYVSGREGAPEPHPEMILDGFCTTCFCVFHAKQKNMGFLDVMSRPSFSDVEQETILNLAGALFSVSLSIERLHDVVSLGGTIGGLDLNASKLARALGAVRSSRMGTAP